MPFAAAAAAAAPCHVMARQERAWEETIDHDANWFSTVDPASGGSRERASEGPSRSGDQSPSWAVYCTSCRAVQQAAPMAVLSTRLWACRKRPHGWAPTHPLIHSPTAAACCAVLCVCCAVYVLRCAVLCCAALRCAVCASQGGPTGTTA
jgi:hypothetical protein